MFAFTQGETSGTCVPCRASSAALNSTAGACFGSEGSLGLRGDMARLPRAMTAHTLSPAQSQTRLRATPSALFRYGSIIRYRYGLLRYRYTRLCRDGFPRADHRRTAALRGEARFDQVEVGGSKTEGHPPTGRDGGEGSFPDSTAFSIMEFMRAPMLYPSNINGLLVVALCNNHWSVLSDTTGGVPGTSGSGASGSGATSGGTE